MATGATVGKFVLSLDTELAWGGVDRPMGRQRREEYLQTRWVIDELLALCEKYDIRATWAVVGHLFLRECEASGGEKHPEVIRPCYGWLDGDWFDNDPCTDMGTDPVWYGPDIVDRIRGCPVQQEIGCHGFSHMIVGDPGCSRECFESELSAMARVVQGEGLQLSSFVFPRNAIGHTDVLAEYGYRVYRGIGPTWHSKLPSWLRRPARLVDAFLPIPPPTVDPIYEGGIWNIPASYQYLHRSGWAKAVPVFLRVRKAVASLRKAARDRTTFHLWSHPFNLASDPKGLLTGLETIFREVKTLRESGLLVNQTMGEFADLPVSRSR